MRFNTELRDGANAGLEKVQKFLEPIKHKHPDLSYSDLWVKPKSIDKY
jgi:catalase (peroxidase I)